MLKPILIRTVDVCARFARLTALAAIAASVLLAHYAAGNLGMDTDTDRLFPSDLAWRQREAAFDRAFPQTENQLVVVIDATTPARADQAARQLAQRLQDRPALFRNVTQPDGDDFFKRNGLLYLSVEELRDLTAQVAEVQPLLGSLASDPSLPTLLTVLGDVAEAVESGEVAAARITGPLTALADSLQSVLDGRTEALSWRAMLTGRTVEADELRRFILVQAHMDYGALSPGAAASAAIREAARELELNPGNGIKVRLTGSVALSDEEFATVAEGTGLAAVVSFILVTSVLFFAVRSARLVCCILAVLVVGIIATCAFAAAAVGTLNIISIAFIVLFIGIAVDFGIQFTVRFLDERVHASGIPEALRATAASTGRSLSLAAGVCAAGFLSLVPTDYRGMGELGLISGAGMLIALALNLTLLPSLLILVRPGGQRSGPGFAWAAPIDRWLIRNRRALIGGAVFVAISGMALVPQVRFDSDPLHLKDPESESVATLYDLMGSPSTTPFTINILEPTVDGAVALANRLRPLHEVERVLTLQSFVPDDQETKLELIDELSLLLGPLSGSGDNDAPPGEAATLLALNGAITSLSAIPADSPLREIGARLAGSLSRWRERYPALLPELQAALLGDLPYELRNLDLALEAKPVDAGTLPDELRQSWIGTDGSARIEVFPSRDIRDDRVRVRFAEAVRAVEPEAGGSVISSLESGRTVVGAFLHAGLVALASITALLFLVLRRLRDTLLVLAPLLFAGLLVIIICALAGLPLNFANIIALPLILGLGVSFSIYFVVNWRGGAGPPLQSATARAVLFSAVTTGVAFGSLTLSTHPGTVSMGLLLSLSLACTLLCILFLLPALLGPSPAGAARRD